MRNIRDCYFRGQVEKEFSEKRSDHLRQKLLKG